MDSKTLQAKNNEETENPIKAIEKCINNIKQKICESDDRGLREFYVNELEYFYDRKCRILQGLPVESRRFVTYVLGDGKLLAYQVKPIND